jgi:peroxiredoxin
LTAVIAGATKEPTAPLEPGETAADFTLKDIHRRPRALADYKDKKAFVVAFIGTECPVANLALPALIELHKDYVEKGVQFLAVNSNSQDSFIEVSAHAQERGVPFPVLKDFDQKVAEQFGAARTPEFFVLDEKHVVRYRGRIDDQATVGVQRAEPTRRDLKEALNEVLAGKTVTKPTTPISGCIIGRVEKPRVKEEVTFANQVSRIMQKRCGECHRPGEIGPMSLLTYEDAKDWADTIHEVVLEQRMPPWHADPRFGKFANDRRLSREESDTLLTWVEQGCAKGDEKDLPPPVKYVEGWNIGQPDKIVTMAEEFKVPAAGVLDYQRFIVDPGFEHDMWVQAAECRPGNRAVVHHILVYILAPGRRNPYDADGTASTLAGWAPGDMPAVYPQGTARRIAAGSKLMFEVHYTPNGVEHTDRSSVGIVFAKEPPAHIAETNILANLNFRIPAGASHYRGEMTFAFPKDAQVLSFMPHMHLRGKSAKYIAHYPDGKTETILLVPDYDFNWQSVYRFAKPLAMPKGTKLTWIGHWDNSADNPRNPDPTKDVGWGLQTWDEMQNGWMDVVWQD